MKKIAVFLIFILVVSLHSSASFAESDKSKFVDGKEWLEKMGVREKLIALYAPHLLLKKHGVPFYDSADIYINRIDKILLYNPYLASEDVANIFASAVYVYEPGSREAIESMARIFEYRRTGNAAILDPGLLLRSEARSELRAKNESALS